MNEKYKKVNALKNLLKTAVREVIREELSTILSESLKSIVPIIKESSTNTASSKIPLKPRPASERVFFDDGPTTGAPSQISEAATNIRKGTFNISDLQAIVSKESHEDPEFKGISEADVNEFIKKYTPKG